MNSKSNKTQFSIFIPIAIGIQFSILKVLLIFFSILFVTTCYANPAVVSAKADTNQIRIGEQFHLKLSATIQPGTKIGFPLLPDTFNHFEVVNKSGIDTISPKGQKELTLQQQLTITGFDSGYFVIPPFPFVISESPGKSDTMLTEAMLISVMTVPVDTTKEIKAIKSIIEVPFPWQEYLIYFLLAWIVIAVILYLYNRFKKKKIIPAAPKIPDRPAHEIALEGLRKIEEEKLWQRGLSKRYFSELTDVLRQYIERRFSVNAMEQTTEEILGYFANGILHDEEKENLKFILRLADMVKFAKAQSLPTENENALLYAFSFVNNTRPVMKEDFEQKEEVK